jgi:hypothetical protein
LLKARAADGARAAPALRAVRARGPDPEARALKEAFRAIYRAPERREAERRLEHFLAAAERAPLPAFTAFADGVRLWRQELVAYFDEPTTSDYAEGVINNVKVIKRRGHGRPLPPKASESGCSYPPLGMMRSSTTLKILPVRAAVCVPESRSDPPGFARFRLRRAWGG